MRTIKRLAQATRRFLATGVSHDEAQRQWEAQRDYQSRTLTRQTKKAGEKAINAILDTTDNLRITQRLVAELTEAIGHWTDAEKVKNPDVYASLTEEVDKKRAAIQRMRLSITTRSRQLQIKDPTSAAHLQKMKTNVFYEHLMNMRSLLVRLRFRLRERKFEQKNMERAYRSQMMGMLSCFLCLVCLSLICLVMLQTEQSAQNHANDAIKRREKPLLALVKKYNERRMELISLKATGAWPAHAVIPAEIKKKSIFQLDIDDVVWSDAGIIDPDDFDGPPPDWLAKEEVRAAIRAHLDIKCCEVDLERLKTECATMVLWFTEEHAGVTKALADASGEYPYSPSYDFSC